jgi:hypothetical protein
VNPEREARPADRSFVEAEENGGSVPPSRGLQSDVGAGAETHAVTKDSLKTKHQLGQIKAAPNSGDIQGGGRLGKQRH